MTVILGRATVSAMGLADGLGSALFRNGLPASVRSIAGLPVSVVVAIEHVRMEVDAREVRGDRDAALRVEHDLEAARATRLLMRMPLILRPAPVCRRVIGGPREPNGRERQGRESDQ